MKGTLKKLVSGAFKKSRDRFFHVNGSQIDYYESEGGKRLGAIVLCGATIDGVPSTYTIVINNCSHSSKDSKKVYRLMATESDYEDWLVAIKAASKGASGIHSSPPSSPVTAPLPPAPAAAAAASPTVPGSPGASAAPKAAPKLSPGKSVGPSAKTFDYGNHKWEPATFDSASVCAICQTAIFGAVMQGRQCKVCRRRCHHKCAGLGGTIPCKAGQAFGGQIDAGDLDLITGFDEGSDGDDDEPQNFMSAFAGLARLTKPAVKKIWNEYDRDNSGTLERAEVEALMRDLSSTDGMVVESKAVERVLKLMDVNGDGLVQWEEFLIFFQGSKDSAFLQQFKGRSIDQASMKKLWDKYDTDGSGSLDQTELMNFMRDLYTSGGACKMGSGQEFFSAFPSFWDPEVRDFNKNPLKWDEFLALMLPLIHDTLNRPDAATRKKMKKAVHGGA